MDKKGKNLEIAVFGGGCFWCTEAVFKMIKGINSVTSGYAGGLMKNPTYEEVSRGDTGHAEVVRIEFDPEEISYDDLLTVFFASHDPTTPDRQGNDVGEQYRSLILFTNEKQKFLAENFIKELNNSNSEGSLVVTEVKPFEIFYGAESYHKDYYEKNRGKNYCELVINPKLEKVQKKFTELLKNSSK